MTQWRHEKEESALDIAENWRKVREGPLDEIGPQKSLVPLMVWSSHLNVHLYPVLRLLVLCSSMFVDKSQGSPLWQSPRISSPWPIPDETSIYRGWWTPRCTVWGLIWLSLSPAPPCLPLWCWGLCHLFPWVPYLLTEVSFLDCSSWVGAGETRWDQLLVRVSRSLGDCVLW
jgi:hypothetical protein